MQKKISMTDRITQELRADIVNGLYYSDSILTEIEVSKKFGGSKTPAREALGALCAEGLLEKLPNKGYLIKRYSLQELDALLEFRSILENALIELAIERATDKEIQGLEEFCNKVDALSEEELAQQCVLLNREFHVRLAKLSRNPFLVSAMENVMDKTRVAMSFDTNTERLMAGHHEILAAIRSRDLEAGKKWANRFLKYLPNSLVGRFIGEL